MKGAWNLCAASLFAVLVATTLRASSPESTVLVVNIRSPESLRVANAWIRMRGIPVQNVVYLDDVPEMPVVPVAAFRERIWQPIKAWLEVEQMTERTDLIVYSVGFPYGVDFDADAKAQELQLRPPISRTASLTAMTFLARHVEQKDAKTYLDLRVNRYFRRPIGGRTTAPRAPTPVENGLAQEAARALASKDHEKASEILGRLVEARPDNASAHYNLACCLALLGSPERAMESLRTAFDNGWANAQHMAGDSDLETLRERDDFGELLVEMRARRVAFEPTRGFRSNLRWTGDEDVAYDGAPEDQDGRYVMSAMLGYVGPNGSTVEQVLEYLGRAAQVDGTRPAGTFYFLENDNVRANTREPLFESAVGDLRAEGFAAEILTKGRDGQNGVLPSGKDDVLGVVAGIAGFDWSKSGSTMVAGAIAEHLTSFGAHFGTKGQTKCVRFLEAGAAGTCGTVAEPYAVQPKFPVPHVHVHYARGASMVEAMYQSIQGPYQTLVLGDPLARPFARFAAVELEAPAPRRKWKGTVEILADVRPADELPVSVVELWVDGRAIASGAAGEPITWDTTTVADGAHELRLVAVDDSRLQLRSTTPGIAIKVANRRATIRAKARKSTVREDGSLTITGSTRGCRVVEIRCGARVLGTVERRTSFSLEIPAASLGVGEVTLHARGESADGQVVLSEPFTVKIDATPAEDGR